MSEPTPEYDLGIPEQMHAFATEEPGLPDEMVRELAAEEQPLVGLNLELIYELTPLVGMVLVTVAGVELIKGLGFRQLLKKRFAYGEETRTTIYKWLTLLVAMGVSFSWGFRELALDLMSVSLSLGETLIYGGLVVATGARLFYEWKLSQIAKDKLYAILHVRPKNAPHERHERTESGRYLNPWTDEPETADDLDELGAELEAEIGNEPTLDGPPPR